MTERELAFLGAGLLIGFFAFPVVVYQLVARDERAATPEQEDHRYGVGGSAYTPQPEPRRKQA